jgi:hypothetical protein
MEAIDEDIGAFLRESCCPRGWMYTLVIVSIMKRYLSGKLPASSRLEFLEHLEKMAADENRVWLTQEMIATVEPMCDRGFEIVREAQKLGARKAVDVYADVFATFAVLNPSLIAALKQSPSHCAKPQGAPENGHHPASQ